MIEDEKKIITAGIIFGIIGLIIGIAGAFYNYSESDLEIGCNSMEYLEEKYDAVGDDDDSIATAQQACVSDYKEAKNRAAFLPNLSLIIILFGVLLINGANKLKNN